MILNEDLVLQIIYKMMNTRFLLSTLYPITETRDLKINRHLGGIAMTSASLQNNMSDFRDIILFRIPLAYYPMTRCEVI